MDDPLFGRLSYEYGWTGKYSVSMFGRKYMIRLFVPCDDGGEIDISQREAFSRFDSRKDEQVEMAADAIFDYYNAARKEAHTGEGLAYARQFMPAIQSSNNLALVLIPTELIVQQPLLNNKRTVGLLFDCAWDRDNGLAVKFENEMIVEVGPQDIVI